MLPLSHTIGRRKEIKNTNKKKIELNNRTGIFCALHTALEWNLLFSSVEERENIGSIRPRSLNDPFTTLPFGRVKKYYGGSVALYIYLVCDSAIPKFLFDPIKYGKKDLVFFFILILFRSINIGKRPLVWKQKSLWRWKGPPIDKIKSEIPFVSYYSLDTESHVMKKQ